MFFEKNGYLSISVEILLQRRVYGFPVIVGVGGNLGKIAKVIFDEPLNVKR